MLPPEVHEKVSHRPEDSREPGMVTAALDPLHDRRGERVIDVGDDDEVAAPRGLDCPKQQPRKSNKLGHIVGRPLGAKCRRTTNGHLALGGNHVGVITRVRLGEDDEAPAAVVARGPSISESMEGLRGGTRTTAGSGSRRRA